MELIIVLALFIALDIAAYLWGIDSRDGVNSLEWERRKLWHSFHEG